MKSTILFAIVAALAAATTPSRAVSLLTVTSYDMPNGNGTAGGGDFNYWDAGYSNCVAGNCTTDGAALSGGAGKLTDGFIPTNSFYGGDGVGAYVGWLANPTITFNFASAQTVNEVKLYVDNSWNSGVAAPASVLIDGTEYTSPAWASANQPYTIDITGLALNSSAISVVLNRAADAGGFPIYWVFMSEAQFFGPSASTTPLPAAWSMMLIGMAGLGVVNWRRRQRKAAPGLA